MNAYAGTDWSADLTGLFPAGVVAIQMTAPGDAACLLPAEAACLGRAVPKRVREFAAGRLCARRALHQFGIDDFAVAVGADREPLWPAGYVGSITHTDGLCAAAVAERARYLGLGIDVERQGAVERHLWPSICASPEEAWLESLPVARAVDFATLVFAAKEAFYKAQFPLVHERLHFHDVAIRVADPDVAGCFTVEPLREIQLAPHVALPLQGAYRIGQGFVYAAIVINRPCRRETP